MDKSRDTSREEMRAPSESFGVPMGVVKVDLARAFARVFWSLVWYIFKQSTADITLLAALLKELSFMGSGGRRR